MPIKKKSIAEYFQMSRKFSGTGFSSAVLKQLFLFYLFILVSFFLKEKNIKKSRP